MDFSEVLLTVFLSLKVAGIATLFNLPVALAASYLLARKEFKGKAIFDGLLNLPLVMPPVTTGYLLLYIFGKKGWIGSALFSIFGIRIAFTQAAAVLAAMVVSFPLITRSIRISMEMVDQGLEKAALTLGAGKRDVFFRITLPLIFPGMINGVILGFARCLGEFGATITFAGNIQGETRTIPLSVYTFLQIPGEVRNASILVLISIIISFLATFLSATINKRLKTEKGNLNESAV